VLVCHATVAPALEHVLTVGTPSAPPPADQVLFSVMQDVRPEMPDDSELPGRPGPSLAAYKQLMEACWQGEAEGRPTFEAIVERLDEMRACDRAARAAERAAMGDAVPGSRRTSYSGESVPASPRMSYGPSSAFGSGRSAATDEAAARGAADSATSIEDHAAAAVALAAANAGRQGSTGLRIGLTSAAGPDGGQVSGPPSPHSSHGAFVGSEPSFAAFAGSMAPGGLMAAGTPFAPPAADAPPLQLHNSAAEALRTSNRTPSRLARGSNSMSLPGAGLPPINTSAGTLGGFGGAAHSPRALAPRPASPFASQVEQHAVQPQRAQGTLAAYPQQQQQQQQQQQPPMPTGNPSSWTPAAQQQPAALPTAAPPSPRAASPFAAVQAPSPFSQTQEAPSPRQQAAPATAAMASSADQPVAGQCSVSGVPPGRPASPFAAVQALSPFSPAHAAASQWAASSQGPAAVEGMALAQGEHSSGASDAAGGSGGTQQPRDECQQRPASPFAAVQRPASPFAAAQGAECVVGESGSATAAGMARVSGDGGPCGADTTHRPRSPFAAVDAASLAPYRSPTACAAVGQDASQPEAATVAAAAAAASASATVTASGVAANGAAGRMSDAALPGPRPPGAPQHAPTTSGSSAPWRRAPAADHDHVVASFHFMADSPALAQLRQDHGPLPASDSLTFPTSATGERSTSSGT
jgi:hypothetical protein